MQIKKKSYAVMGATMVPFYYLKELWENVKLDVEM
jgi:hypothetical protein